MKKHDYYKYAVIKNKVRDKNMNMQISASAIDRVLIMNEVCKVTGLSKPTIYRLMKQSLFPRQLKIGIEAVGWLESDLVKFINKRASQQITTKGA